MGFVPAIPRDRVRFPQRSDSGIHVVLDGTARAFRDQPEAHWVEGLGMTAPLGPSPRSRLPPARACMSGHGRGKDAGPAP